MKVAYHEDAIADIQDAVRYYSEISWRLMERFEAELQRFRDAVTKKPFHYHFASRRTYRRPIFVVSLTAFSTAWMKKPRPSASWSSVTPNAIHRMA